MQTQPFSQKHLGHVWLDESVFVSKLSDCQLKSHYIYFLNFRYRLFLAKSPLTFRQLQSVDSL